MAQFGAGKNPPWARPQAGVTVSAGLAASLNQPQVGNPLLGQPGVANPTVYSLGASQASLAQQQFALQQQAAVSQIGQVHPGIAIPTTLATTQVATVSYPTPRAAQQPQPKQRVFTGVVTKLHDNFGFVDEDVFFQTSCVKGHPPKVGDRVLVEASYNANMPFKWNATRIQVLPTQPGGMQQQQQQLPPPQFQPPGPVPLQNQQTFKQPSVAAPSIPPPTITPSITPSVLGPITPSQLSHPPPPLMAQGGLLPPPNHGRFNAPAGRSDRGRYDRDRERDRERDRGERERRRSPKRARSRSPRRRSPRRSPPRRRPARIVPRYVVQVPKITLDIKEANVMKLRSRYTNLYIPSDFFNAGFAWAEAFPLHRRFQLGNHCVFHVMSKEVEALEPNTAVLEPPDADHLYSAKVMLMSSPTLEELYNKTCALAEDSTEQKEGFQHPTRLLSFLVGLKGKSEPMAIGGPWSPSLDGPNPAEDPAVLTRTAIRTTKALTGVDLSACTQWYRFAEIHYHRPEETHKGRVVPARVETVVLFLPDVWSCLPTRLEWEVLQTTYKHQLTDKIAEEGKEEQEEEEDGGDENAEKKDPTHYSELDPKALKLVDLRKELEARTLSSKGLKSQLIARLTKALKTEQEKEEQEAENKEAEEENKKEEEEEKMETDEKEEEKKKKEDEEKKRREEREKVARERRYTLPDSPAILVHPSSVAKSGKFDCTNMSLSVLLDYRPEDNKEHTFEVSLFAELFNEMLMRDFGFGIYKALVVAPERKEEEKDKDKKEKDEKHKERSASKEPNAKRRKTDEKEEKDDKKEEKEEKEAKAEVKEEKKEKKDEKKEETKDEKEKEDKKDEEEDEEDEEEEEDAEEEDDDEGNKKKKDKDKKKDKEKKREKVKFYTAHPELLLAFVYFDQNHTGYLLDKDVEEIIHTLGLQLSRAQVRKLVQKLVSRDTLNYRKITDKPYPKEGADSQEGEHAEAKGEDQAAALDDETMAIGNNIFMIKAKKEPAEKETPTRSSRRNKKDADQKEETVSTSDTGMVMYKGSLLDLDSFMQRLEKSEKARVQLEHKLKEYQDDMDSLKGSFNNSEQHSQKVVLELQELKKKLRDQTKATGEAENLVKKYHAALDSSKNTLSKTLNEITSALVKQEPTEETELANGDK